MQTILGSGGAVGIGLARELAKYTDEIRLVSRNPKSVNAGDKLFAANLLDKELVNKAVAGSEVVYLTAGLTYHLKTWKQQWPVIMTNVIEACIQHQTKLVFFDNVYMYSISSIGHMKEDAPVDPPSEKGKVRAALSKMIFDAIEQKGLKAMIARSADFYGKDVKSGFLNIGVIDNFKKGKKAFWQADATKVHSFTFVPDAAKAVAILGNTPDAYGQVWHMPTSAQKWTGKDFINFIAGEMNVSPRYYILSKFLLSFLGVFSPTLRELKEMQYQNDRDYFFDSSKIEKRFNIKPTPYEKGICESIL